MFKYEAIAEDIQNKIQSGYYQPDEKLPQELELCRQYDASRITIREAMEMLVHKGLIIKRRGSGTFVKTIAGNQDDRQSFARSLQFAGFSKEHEGHEVTSDVHEFQLLRAEKRVAELLQVAEGAFVCYICRTRSVDGVPLVVEYTYMPTEFIPGITDEVVHSSIYSYLENTLGLKIQSAHRIARAVMPTEQEQEWLDIRGQEIPLFEVEQTAYLDDGRIFEYSRSRHRGDCYEFRSVSIR